MDLTPYLEGLRADLAALAAPGGPDVARAAEVLGASLEPSARMVLLEALSDAAAEITTRLNGPTVEVRLRGREADLVVGRAVPEPASSGPPSVPAYTDGELSRLTLRMPESLKAHVEQIAAAEGISVNAWLVRAVTSAAHEQRPGNGRRVTGFYQA
ncbi:toxin-antitoxin system HicB family antitoxin [Actinoplanes rectilineatus]|uniref:toxin-antitoxin system HicB family antitoxin n=1 Tax=Actinoplanes rectilineatus TaxID=113571 RepID=UPI0005F2E341|nr:toxin-antitoxin system HicB family antitoxin [Actinoplanes rectilineatus]